jgi:hypothetical protein
VALVPFAVPYAPNLVPIPELGGEPTQQLVDLTRYLQEEFIRIQTALTFVPVQAAYGALNVSNGPIADQPLDTSPSIITGWDSFSPEQPNRIAATITGNSLTPTEGGVYWVQVQIAATIDTNTTYTITVAINGVVGSVFGVVDAGNQSTVITISFYGLVELDAGDLITVVGEATSGQPAPYTFIMESGTFSVVRVSEFHGRDAASVP